MADPVFFPLPEPLTIAKIAELTGANPARGSDTARRICRSCSARGCRPEDVTFFDNARYGKALAETRAGACFVRRAIPR
jgi:UDP-3-O-[3-hydroxymyristoyl] glucosamine N-acyltransferase